MAEGPKYYLGQKLDNDKSPMKNNPGPGAYELMNKDNLNMTTSKKFGIGTS